MTGIESWTIFENPTDYPGQTIARRFRGLTACTGPEDLIIADVETLRHRFETAGLVRIPRSQADAKSVLETWL